VEILLLVLFGRLMMRRSEPVEGVEVHANVLILYGPAVVVEEWVQKRRYFDDGVSCFLIRCGSHFSQMALHPLFVSCSQEDSH
jgi:hypothetical protein